LIKLLIKLLGVVLLIAVALGVGYFTPRQWGASPAAASCEYKICVVKIEIHTDLILPIQNEGYDWRTVLGISNPKTQYVGFGWGEKNWYQDPPTQLLETLVKGSRALLLPNPAILRVQEYDRLPTDRPLHCMGISRDEYLALVQYIQNSFARSQGERVLIAAHPADHTSGAFKFYAATGTYSLFHTSNDWTADGLRRANVNTPLWAGLASSIMRLLKSTC
jgi:uncharacterized protein (TIGR02117 family)